MKNGPYELILAPKEYPGKRYRGRYAYEHIVKWWKHSGSVPLPGYEIHHVNGNHRDNRIENLRLVSRKEHRELHRRPITYREKRCGVCNAIILKEARQTHGRSSFYCSRKHQHLSMTKAFRDVEIGIKLDC